MRELGVVCHAYACFCTFYTSEMNTHSYMPFYLAYFCVTCIVGRTQIDHACQIN